MDGKKNGGRKNNQLNFVHTQLACIFTAPLNIFNTAFQPPLWLKDSLFISQHI